MGKDMFTSFRCRGSSLAKLSRLSAKSICCHSGSRIYLPSSENKEGKHRNTNCPLVVLSATTATKLLGLYREVLFAATLGIGETAEIYNYSSVVPGLFVVLFGGVNGAFHSSLVAVLARQRLGASSSVLRHVWFRVSPILIALTIAVSALSRKIIELTASGLHTDLKNLAARQLLVMSPSIWLSGRVGLGFGLLSSEGNLLLPALSSGLSSCAMILVLKTCVNLPPMDLKVSTELTSLALAASMPLGVAAQWLVQHLALARQQPTAAQAPSVTKPCIPPGAPVRPHPTLAEGADAGGGQTLPDAGSQMPADADADRRRVWGPSVGQAAAAGGREAPAIDRERGCPPASAGEEVLRLLAPASAGVLLNHLGVLTDMHFA
eukprot:CAMPEP_0177613130 /NCGR_PEP_ID=MMETSP0419_2-20121207/21749_1 /TAXON_ID=582737 /ORGANISM="Tetraselmis sp., Strain GSL018" /LENGTH=377 /DNA_ID=CAMNT_0019109683 /DNA_START=220 /DNA_END=1349 /DNA_ORIENTATION=-